MTTSFKRFQLGASEVAAAEAWRIAGTTRRDEAVRFYKEVVRRHQLDLEAFRPDKNRRRSLEEQEAFDFIRLGYATVKVGHKCAQELFDKNIAGDCLVYPSGRVPQSRRSLQQSLFGAKDWGKFLDRLIEIQKSVPEDDWDDWDDDAKAPETQREELLRNLISLFDQARAFKENLDGSISREDIEKCETKMTELSNILGG